MDETPTLTRSEQRTYRAIACCATVPILLVCAFLVWALPQLDPLGKGRADGAVIWPIGFGLIVLSLLVGVFQASHHRSAGCLLGPLVILGLLCAWSLSSMVP